MTDAFRADFVSWLADAGRNFRDTLHLVDGLCRFLNQHGYRIRRCNLATETVHPQMKAIRLVWSSEPREPSFINPEVLVQRRIERVGEAMIDEAYFRAGSRDSPQYRSSPFHQIELDGELHSHIDPDQTPYRFPVFADLAELGCRGYFGLRLQSCAGYQQTISFATDREDGFDKGCLDDLRWCMGLFNLLLDMRLEHEVKTTLARTYLGAEPGRLVLGGMISPGDVRELEAAIWFSDLRGFTRLSSALDPAGLVRQLNRYFSTVVDAIHGQSGEVLKFIGDAVLAIFPVERFGRPDAACEAALAAARDAGARLAGMNAGRIARGDAAMAHGIALHLGTVQFGNIGTLQRLDFTVVGAEVNLTSRIGGLCGLLGEEILMSEAVSRLIDAPVRSLGTHALKGIAEPVEVFAPAAG